MIFFLISVPLISLLIAFYNFGYVITQDEGQNAIKEIAEKIRKGTNTFLKMEYTQLILFAVMLCAFICIVIHPEAGIACAIGVIMSALPALIGMNIATHANSRTTNTAAITKNIANTVKVAFSGGSVMGFSVAAFSLIGALVVCLLYGYHLEDFSSTHSLIEALKNPFCTILSSYSLGCSIVAMFGRIGGGIYTKAADMAADIVGKVEFNIPEDDIRNPASIADNVGDNVGDVAGLGPDLLESNVGSIVSAMMLGINLFIRQFTNMSVESLKNLTFFPLIVATCGLLSCIIGISFVLGRPMNDRPHEALNKATYISATLTAIFSLIAAKLLFKNSHMFILGAYSPWAAILAGIITGILIGKISEYYTSDDYKPTKKIAQMSKSGAPLTINQGVADSMQAPLIMGIVIVLAILISYGLCDMYGVALAGCGMLSFVATTVSVDTFGPISDNAGGIAEMSHLDDTVRKITDELDSVGNTTAAIGKGFAIGSAAFTALGLMVNYLNAFQTGNTLILNAINIFVLSGFIIGTLLPGFFSGMLIKSVIKAAFDMVEEVKWQFKNIPGLLEGKPGVQPDYTQCIKIATKTSLKEMKRPAILAVVVPVLSGLIFGPEFVAGILLGSILSSIFLAIFFGTAGGQWDNAKKFIEKGLLYGENKGTPAHIASVIGDTVGDSWKDTAGPCLDIFIKIETTASLVFIGVFSSFNLINWIMSLF